MTKPRKLLKILIAEDDVDILESYKEICELNNFNVLVAKDGDECLDIYREEFLSKKLTSDPDVSNSLFDVVILDYMMPGKNGLQSAQVILSINPHQRIIFASAYLEGTISESIKQLGKVIRLQTALKLLLNQQSENLTQIAYESEYYDQAHFNRDFKEFTGINPKDFLQNGKMVLSSLFYK